MNKEDIFPQWMRDTLKRQGFDAPRPIIRICQVCNSRMAKIFEEPIAPVLKPIFDGFRTELSPEQRLKVVAWFTKTTLLLEYRHASHDSTDPRSELLRTLLLNLIDNEELPPGTSLLLGAVDMSAAGRSMGTHAVPLRAFVSRGSLGTLLYQVVIGRPVDTAAYLDLLTQHDRRFVEAWPLRDKTLSWPPPIAFVLKDAIAFSQRHVADNFCDVPRAHQPLPPGRSGKRIVQLETVPQEEVSNYPGIITPNNVGPVAFGRGTEPSAIRCGGESCTNTFATNMLGYMSGAGLLHCPSCGAYNKLPDSATLKYRDVED